MVRKQPQQENLRFGNKLTVRYPDNMNAVKDSVGMSPKQSLRRRFHELGFSHESLQSILNKDLQLYSYKIKIKDKLTPADMEKNVSVINHYINGLYLF